MQGAAFRRAFFRGTAGSRAASLVTVTQFKNQ
jgi:hypothetical protein